MDGEMLLVVQKLGHPLSVVFPVEEKVKLAMILFTVFVIADLFFQPSSRTILHTIRLASPKD